MVYNEFRPDPNDFIVLVMGPTGTGKTNFINTLTGNTEQYKAGNLRSDTQRIAPHRIMTGQGDRVVLVDVPGFDDTYRPDTEIQRIIADWVTQKYPDGDTLVVSGIIYLHRITDNRMSVSVQKNLEMFHRLCGDSYLPRVRLVTTMWDKVRDRSMAERRESVIIGEFWRDLISEGAVHIRFNNTRTCAWNIVHELTRMGRNGDLLLLQEELLQQNKRLNETKAAKFLHSRFQQLLAEQKKTLKELADEAKMQDDPALAHRLHEEYDKINANLQWTFDEMNEMKIPITRRIYLQFSKGMARLASVRRMQEIDFLPYYASIAALKNLFTATQRTKAEKIDPVETIQSLPAQEESSSASVGNLMSPYRSFSQIVHTSDAVLESWRKDNLLEAIEILSQETRRSDQRHHVLATHAFLRARLRQWGPALRDARKSIAIQPTILAYVAISMALFGRGDVDSAKKTFNRLFLKCDVDDACFVILIKAVVIFTSRHHEEGMARIVDLIVVCSKQDATSYHAIQTHMRLLAGKACIGEKQYDKALKLLANVQDPPQFPKHPQLDCIAMMFGWSNDPDAFRFTLYQQRCEALYGLGRQKEARQLYDIVLKEFEKKSGTGEDMKTWLREFKQRRAM